jgi:hypothetical protein
VVAMLGLVAWGGTKIYRGFRLLGTRAEDDAAFYFVVGGILVVIGLVGLVRPRWLGTGRASDLKDLLPEGAPTPADIVGPPRKPIWVLYPLALLSLWGGLAILFSLRSPARPQLAEQFWVVEMAMQAAVGVALMLAGAIGALALVRRHVDAVRDAKLRAAHPDSPWMWRTDWASGRIRQQRGVWLLFGWPLAFLLLGFALQVVAQGLQPGMEFEPLSLLALAVPLGVFAWAVLSTARRLKYGRSELVLETVPVVVGGVLKGRIEAPIRNWTPQADGKGISAKLSSIHTWTTGTRKQRSSHHTVLWSDEQQVPAPSIDVSVNGIAIPVTFSLPSGVPSTDKRNADDQFFWQLDVRAAQPGLDYHEWFEVPVFHP